MTFSSYIITKSLKQKLNYPSPFCKINQHRLMYKNIYMKRQGKFVKQ